MKQRGFTLVELIVVMVITGVLAGVLIVFFRPAFTNYLASGRRATLSDMADGALRRMARDIRSAVPNSVRQNGANHIELVPTIAGGRFRFAADTQTPAMASDSLDSNAPGSSFDVLTTLAPGIQRNDWIVIGNQTPSDLGSGLTRTQFDKFQTVAGSRIGTTNILLQTKANIPPGYEGGRFVVVPDAQKAVIYICNVPSPALDANGTGRGVLYRVAGNAFSANLALPAAFTTSQILATKVQACTFTYDQSSGATMENGYVEMSLQLTDQNESITLFYGVHVDNVP